MRECIRIEDVKEYCEYVEEMRLNRMNCDLITELKV